MTGKADDLNFFRHFLSALFQCPEYSDSLHIRSDHDSIYVIKCLFEPLYAFITIFEIISTRQSGLNLILLQAEFFHCFMISSVTFRIWCRSVDKTNLCTPFLIKILCRFISAGEAVSFYRTEFSVLVSNKLHDCYSICLDITDQSCVLSCRCDQDSIYQTIAQTVQTLCFNIRIIFCHADHQAVTPVTCLHLDSLDNLTKKRKIHRWYNYSKRPSLPLFQTFRQQIWAIAQLLYRFKYFFLCIRMNIRRIVQCSGYRTHIYVRKLCNIL